MGLVTLSLFSHTVQDLVAAVFLMLEETLVEARSGSDVQIDRQTWV